jgi:hypothetical protein
MAAAEVKPSPPIAFQPLSRSLGLGRQKLELGLQ